MKEQPGALDRRTPICASLCPAPRSCGPRRRARSTLSLALGVLGALFLGPPATASVFTYPDLLNDYATSDAAVDSEVMIVWGADGLGGGQWVAAWETNENLNGTAGADKDIVFATSANGESWSATALLNTNGPSDSGSDQDVELATDGGGNWVAVWQSHENLNGTTGTEGDILAATSSDNGSTWTAPALLNTTGSSDGFGDIDSGPEIATDGAGTWIAAWQSFYNLNGTAGTDLDILMAVSTDNGATWSDPQLLNNNGTSDSGPNTRDIAPQIASNHSGEWIAVWHSETDLGAAADNDYDIFFAQSSNNGSSWSAPALLNSNGNSDNSDSGHDTYPQVIWDGVNNWISVWDSSEDLNGTAGMDGDIFVSTLRDTGGGWTAPILLDPNGATDSGSDTAPRITTDGAGHWVTVWHSTEDITASGSYMQAGDIPGNPTGIYDGTTGPDADILVAIATSPADGDLPFVESVSLLNANGTSDKDFDTPFGAPMAWDSYASVATDADGQWVAAWQSSGDLAGAGTDSDLFFAASVDIDGDNWPDSVEGALGADALDAASRPGNASKLLHPEGAAGDLFGEAVAISGDTVIVGSDLDDHDGLVDAGSALVFIRDPAGLWALQQTLFASDAAGGDRFGISVAISGDTAIVGAHGDDDNSGGDLIEVGAAYVFTRTAGVWTEQQKLLARAKGGALDGGEEDFFGFSVGVSGDAAIVGAYRNDSAGAAYVFARNAGNWTVQEKLVAGDAEAGDALGYAVAVSGATAVVSGHGGDDNGPQSGSAYVFTETGGVWSEQQKLLPGDGNASDSFGFSLGISGETVIVGADLDDIGADTDAGSAYVFTRSGETWTQQQKLLPDDGAAEDNFGWAVSISGDLAVVGALGDDYLTASFSGSGYEFKRDGQGQWTQLAKLVAPDRTGVNDMTARSVAIEGDTAILGAQGAEPFGSQSGAAYAFVLDADGDSVLDSSDNCPLVANLDQLDSDGDTRGDACDDDDADGVLDTLDNCPLLANPDQLDTDGDTQGDVCDNDDDGDGLLDIVETNTGVYVSESDTGTHPLNPDSDGDGLLDGLDLAPNDGGDCRSLNPQLEIVWGHPTPFGLVHQNEPGIGHRYLLDQDPALGLPGLSELSVPGAGEPGSLPDLLASKVGNLFRDARPLSLPATSNGITVGYLLSSDPLPSLGTTGSPSLIFLVDRATIELTDPDFGPLRGFAWTGVNRFNATCSGGEATVIVDAIPAPSDPDYAAFVVDLIELIAHEAGHLYGLRHVLADGKNSCIGEVYLGTEAVMDYYPPEGPAATLAQCSPAPGQGCPVTEPPNCSGEETGDDHNPLYHFLHYVIGDSTDALGSILITPGSWDMEGEPLVRWRVEFDFGCEAICNILPLYNISIVEVLPSGAQVVREFYEELSIEQLNALTIELPESSGLMLYASTTNPETNGGQAPTNVVLQTPLTPPADPAAPVVIISTLLEVEETSPGVYQSTTLAEDSNVSTTPVYEVRATGTYDVSDPNVPDGTFVSTSTYIPPLAVTGAPVGVPEPGFGMALASGLAGLLSAHRWRTRRRPK